MHFFCLCASFLPLPFLLFPFLCLVYLYSSHTGVWSTLHTNAKTRCLHSLATMFTHSLGIPLQTHFSTLLRDSGPFGTMFNSSATTVWDPLQVLILSFSCAQCSDVVLFSSTYGFLLLAQLMLFLYYKLHLWSCSLIAFFSFSAFKLSSSFFLSEHSSLCLDLFSTASALCPSSNTLSSPHVHASTPSQLVC